MKKAIHGCLTALVRVLIIATVIGVALISTGCAAQVPIHVSDHAYYQIRYGDHEHTHD